MPPIGQYLGIPESRRTFEGNRILALQKCLTGLEFEAEGVTVVLPHEEDDAGFWQEKPDNSLRHGPGDAVGKEYVLREPLFGDDLVRSVNWLCEFGTKHRFDCNYRTGLHVHISVQNLEIDELITMLVYYALFEKVIFNWVGDDREGNIFCMPFYKAGGSLNQIIDAISKPKDMKAHAEKIDRYSALNLNALSRFGTVEWRHLKTTFNSERVLKWINIAQSFKRHAKNHPLKPHELLAELSSSGPASILGAILGPNLSAELWVPGSLRAVEDYGIPVAQEIATLLNGSVGVAWDSVRSALGTGDNPRWVKWVEKEKERSTLTKLPDNLFSDPELLKDKEFQKEAMTQLIAALKEQLVAPISIT